MSTTHTQTKLSSSFTTFLEDLHASLLNGDFKVIEGRVIQEDYFCYTFTLGAFKLSFSLNYTISHIVHFPHSSSLDLSPFEEEFNFILFSSILDNRKKLSL